MTSFRRRLFAVAQLCVAVTILMGSSFEVLNLLVPSLVPEIQDVPLMRLHHSVAALFYWTLLSNIVSALLALVLIGGAVGTFRNEETASRRSRQAIAGFLGIVAGATIMSSVYLLPPILAMLHSAGGRSMGVILLVSVCSSLVGLTVMMSTLFIGHGIIQREERSAAIRAGSEA